MIEHTSPWPASRASHQQVRFVFLALVSALFSVGCAGTFGAGLDVRKVNSAAARPSNVWVFFEVTEGKGEPVPGLEADDFEIYEDDRLVSKAESQQTIQNPDIAAVMYTLLLVDMSGSVAESGDVEALADAAEKFSESVGEHQKVAIYAFDGEEDLHPLVQFTGQKGSASAGISRLRTYKPKDTSTNLHGAVVKGIELLNKELERDHRPLKFGTLVVFSDGTDRAARVSQDEMQQALRDEKYKNYQVYAIGVGDELEERDLSRIGRDGTELVREREKVDQAFQRMAQRIDAHRKRFYLFSYCTPARKGVHRVRVKVIDKERNKSGDVEYEFDADGFGPPPKCDPARKPSFDLKNIDADPPEGSPAGKATSSVMSAPGNQASARRARRQALDRVRGPSESQGRPESQGRA